uniref:Gustatory receptor n=1 Tax=Diabrotica virgifera virgifera TaxID=50390 RepID=A0A6P7G9E4_DIAVI
MQVSQTEIFAIKPETQNPLKTSLVSRIFFIWMRVLCILPLASTNIGSIWLNRLYSTCIASSAVAAIVLFTKYMLSANEISSIITQVIANMAVFILISNSSIFHIKTSIALKNFLKYFIQECKTKVPFPTEQFIFHIAFAMYAFVDLTIWSSKFKFFYFSVITILSRYFLVFGILCSGHIALIFRNRFKQINETVKNMRLKLYPGEKDLLRDLLVVRKDYQQVLQYINNYNTIFGYFFIFCHLFVLLQVVNDIHTMITKIITANYDLLTFTGRILPPSLTFVAIVFSIMCCDVTSKEGKELTKICYHLFDECVSHRKHSEVPQLLLQFIEYCTNFPPTFTAADFYEIERTTILEILGIALTYLIVVVQFDGIA